MQYQIAGSYQYVDLNPEACLSDMKRGKNKIEQMVIGDGQHKAPDELVEHSQWQGVED